MLRAARLVTDFHYTDLIPHHTFATRCIEAGMRPKTLQQILGHSSINITMNLYVHVTDEEKTKEMQKFEEYSIKI